MTQPDVNIESEPRTSNGAGDIVVGVDGSEESFTALQWTLREASLSGRAVNAVYAWTHSWDMGAQPDNPDAWEKASKAITEQLLDWVNEASAGIAFDPDNLKLTSVHASGTTGLLQIGADAQQIVVGRRSPGSRDQMVRGVAVVLPRRIRQGAGDGGQDRRQRGQERAG